MERILSRSPSQHSATASENSHRLAPDPAGLWSLKTTRFFRCEKIYKTLPMSECSYKTNRTCSTIITQDYWVHTIQFSKRVLISFSSSYIFCQWSISPVEDISGRSRYNKCEELFCAGKPGWVGLFRQSYHIEMEMGQKLSDQPITLNLFSVFLVVLASLLSRHALL